MTDEQRQEFMRRQAAGLRAMSKDEMARRQLAAANGAQNAPSNGFDFARGQQAMNAWCEVVGAAPVAQLPKKPRVTLLARFRRLIRG